MRETGAPCEAAERSARHERILDASQASFVRNGIHRTTMQDIAGEAAMSPGNIYRYYVSKEAIIVDLAKRAAESAAAMADDLETKHGRRAALMAVIERCFVAITRENAVLRLDLWAEATRSPAIAALIAQQEANSRAWFVAALAELVDPQAEDAEALWTIVDAALKGFVVSRALGREPDVAADLRRLEGLLGLDRRRTPA